jgi:hypothetical protein
MKTANKFRYLWLFISLGILLGLLCVFLHPFEPRYQGKRLSAWVEDLPPDMSGMDEPPADALPKVPDTVIAAFQYFGVQAIPAALKLCGADDLPLKEKLIDWCEDWNRKHEKYQIHIANEETAHLRSREIFNILGSTGTPAIPALIKLFQSHNPAVGGTACANLFYIGTNAVPPLSAALTHQNWQVRMFAAISLAHFKSASKSAEPALLQCLQDENREVRSYAAIALMEAGADAATAVPALIGALEKDTNNSYSGVLSALGHYGAEAKPAVPLLLKMVQATQKQPAWLPNPALIALHKIDPETAQPYIDAKKSALPTR